MRLVRGIGLLAALATLTTVGPGSQAGTVVAENPAGAAAPSAAPSQAMVPGSAQSAASDAKLLLPGQVSAFDCVTEAFGMDFTPFKKTGGTIRLTISGAADAAASDSDPNSVRGSWQVSGQAETHVASIAKLLAQACSEGCPLTVSAKAEVLMWSPAPKTLDKLGEKETLTIAVLKPDPLSVSISTFRGRDIVALEKGDCRQAGQ